MPGCFSFTGGVSAVVDPKYGLGASVAAFMSLPEISIQKGTHNLKKRVCMLGACVEPSLTVHNVPNGVTWKPPDWAGVAIGMNVGGGKTQHPADGSLGFGYSQVVGGVHR